MLDLSLMQIAGIGLAIALLLLAWTVPTSEPAPRPADDDHETLERNPETVFDAKRPPMTARVRGVRYYEMDPGVRYYELETAPQDGAALADAVSRGTPLPAGKPLLELTLTLDDGYDYRPDRDAGTSLHSDPV